MPDTDSLNDHVVDPKEQEKAEAKAAADAAAKAESEKTAGDVAGLRKELEDKTGKLKELEDRVAVVDRIREAIEGGKINPRDELLRKELIRLLPEVGENAKIKELLTSTLHLLETSAEEHLGEKVVSAQDVMRGCMKDAGLDPEDADACSLLEEALTAEIRNNKDLLAQWTRGNVKNAVNKAFEKIESKLFAPVRARTKRSAVATVFESPKASPRGAGGADTDKGTKKLDYADTSRENVKKIHDAAFERLQQLSER